MRKNYYGKKFEKLIKEYYSSFDDLFVYRIPDQMSKFKGSKNICDFIIYNNYNKDLIFIECKTTKLKRFPLSNFSQYVKMYEICRKYKNIKCYLIVDYYNYNTTLKIPVEDIDTSNKSIYYFEEFENIYGKIRQKD